ncbi:hypothetical protein BC830DRAFT_1062883 [Chytriomyces sp. MP71]|nr:hypothetical protein BC830DRAFT_1062883 [Chytriomyces sp. MP71]
MLFAVAGESMAQRKVLIKDLRGVETLGAITMLASDKKGTLTMNEMKVSRISGVYDPAHRCVFILGGHEDVVRSLPRLEVCHQEEVQTRW